MWGEELTLIGQYVPHLYSHPWECSDLWKSSWPTCSDLWRFSCQPAGWCEFLLLLLPTQWLPPYGPWAREASPLQKKTSTATIAGATSAATSSIKPSRPDLQSWRKFLSGKIYCDLGKDKEDPRKLLSSLVSCLSVSLQLCVYVDRTGINFLKLNLSFSHHKNRSNTNIKDVLSVHFLP